MKKKGLAFLLIFAFVAGTMFTSNAAEASDSNASLQKQIKSLQSTVAKQKKQLVAKDNQIASLKKSATYAVTPLKTKVAYQGNVLSGVYQIGSTSVPVSIDYKGVKYTPVDLVGNLLQNKAIYNKTSDTVYFGTEPSGSYISDILNPYYIKSGYDNPLAKNQIMTMAGQKYNKGFSLHIWNTGSYSFNLNSKYSNLSGVVGIEDGSTKDDSKITVYGDGELLGTYDIVAGDLPQNLSIDVTNVKKLEFHVEGNYGYFNLANPIIK